ncbi:MAG: TetR/AcrR family transcriptional regulator [Micromonosporaceae bacterium]|nr:TetR/AcrR family transcriptional regulator [Micromonosporaceae bacterium]
MSDMAMYADAVPAGQERKAPGRPRSARADEAIIDAVLDLLAAGTPAGELSMEAVAAKAGVGKATIYRRWPNKEALIVDAVGTVKGEVPELAGESLREDLLALLLPTRKARATRAGQIVPCLLSEFARNPELNRCWQRLLEPRREALREVLRRGIARGEIRPDVDLEVVSTMLSATLFAQRSLGWNPHLAQADLAERLVDTTLAMVCRKD